MHPLANSCSLWFRMRTRTAGCRSLIGMAFAILGVVVCAPSARATCGDYLHIGGQPTKPVEKPAAPKPCDGPNCSSRPAIPPVAPARVTPHIVEAFALFEHIAGAEPDQRRGLVPPDDGDAPIRSSTFLFRPPR